MTKIIPKLPDSERYDLRDQLSRSSKAVPELIAEGFAKKHQDDALSESNETQVGLCQSKDIYPRNTDTKLCEELIAEYDIISKQIYRLSEAWSRFSKKPKNQDL